MPTVIDITFFTSATGATIPQRGQEGVKQKVQNCINKWEPDLLRTLLGVAMYDEYIAALAAPLVDDKWIKLTNGTNYTDVAGNQRYWPGLRSMTDNAIVCYVYYWYIRTETVILSGSGPVITQNENSVRASPVALQARVYNDMVKLNKRLFDFLRSNMDLYPDWPYYDINFNINHNWFPLLRRWPNQFYRDNLARFFDRINQFGL
jgi:hypothetical protein